MSKNESSLRFCETRSALCEDRACRMALAVFASEFYPWKLSPGFLSSCGRGLKFPMGPQESFDSKVQMCITRNALPQLRVEIATFLYKVTARCAFPQKIATCTNKLARSARRERRADFHRATRAERSRKDTGAEQFAQNNVTQLSQSNLRRQLAQSILHTMFFTEFCRHAQSNSHRALAQSNLRKAYAQGNYEEQLARTLCRPTCTEPSAQSQLHRVTSADQAAQSHLRRPTCACQLAQSTLRRAVHTERSCTELLAQRHLYLHKATCTSA